jgi:gliding motility-associated-like protein
MNLKKLLTLAFFLLPIYISAQRPNAAFTVNMNTLCEGDSAEFTNNSTNYTNLHWFFGDGSDTWSREISKHKYESAGTFKVKLIAISPQGRDSTEQTVIIDPKPAVQIAVSPQSIISLGEKATLSVSNGFVEYLWSTGAKTASIEVFQQNYYWVRIVNVKGCSNSDTIFIAVIQQDMNISSNILTPNLDGYNDFLEVQNLSDFNFPVRLLIYNIRNELIYESSDYQNDWYGEDFPAGTYFYILKTDDRRDKAGTINILR